MPHQPSLVLDFSFIYSTYSKQPISQMTTRKSVHQTAAETILWNTYSCFEDGHKKRH